jgi:ribosome-associated protein
MRSHARIVDRCLSEVTFDFVRASGPGGQNVNKVATAAQLRFDLSRSPTLSQDIKQRLTQLAQKRITRNGLLIIEARRYRTQEQNRQDALDRLASLLDRALTPPKPRVETKPSRASRERRLQSKKKRGNVKQGRASRFDD